MALFNQNSPGLLGNMSKWMTPDRAAAFQAVGMGLSQLGAGQPVNLSPAYDALRQRQQRAEMQRTLEGSGVLDKFTPQQRAILAQMEPTAAQRIIAGVLFAPPEKPKTTDDITEYTYAQGQGYKGSFADWQMENRRAGATTVNVGPTGIDYGQPPKDMAWARNPDGTVQTDERGAPMAVMVRGSPTDVQQTQDLTKMAGEAIGRAEKGDAADSAAITVSETVTRSAARAREARRNQQMPSGVTSIVGNLPWTDAAEVQRQVDTLKSIAAAENINAMRKASPTGGALGNASDADIKLLKDKSGALDPNSPNFERDLDDYERTLLRTIHGQEAGDRIFEATRDVKPEKQRLKYNPETGDFE